MPDTEIRFKHSTPDLYDRFMGPLLFEPWARIVAQRAALLRPARILETAAGTGILTRALHRALPDSEIVATDINPVMLELAAQRLHSNSVSYQPANAQDLPFHGDSFDLVVCQFGVMFFPDKVKAHHEARRVLQSNGHYLLVSFDQVANNPVPRAAGKAVSALFPDAPLKYMEHGPFSYADRELMERDLQAAGFTGIELETISATSRVNAREAAQGMVLGSPLRAEIEARDPAAFDRALEDVTVALMEWDGKDAPMSAHIAIARK